MRRVVPIVFAAAIVTAQPAFEVASIRPHAIPPGQPVFRKVSDGFSEEIKGNRVTGLMLTLTQLIADAYGVRDFQIQGAPDWAKPEAGRPGAQGAPPPEDNGPSIFTALQEQLGLKLESSRQPVETLVIDSVERPSQN